YVWREEGYILVPPFWDYPLEERGKAYCSLFLDESQRRGYVHTPTVVMQPEMIIEQIFPYWPDYICFFHHWHHFHPGFWDNWCCTPPWWGWDAWWGFGPFHMWDLWWWWSHPGFPFPWWMPGWMGGWIVPPGGIVIDIMIGFGPPIFIGPFGPWPLMALLDAIFSVTGKNLPILPADPAMREEILKKVPPLVGDSGNQRPSGTPDGRVPEKPFDQPQAEVPRSPGGSAVPSKPRPAQPPVQTYPQPPYTPEPPQQFYPRPRPRPMPMPPEQGYPRPRPRPQPPRYPWPPSDSYRPQPDRGDVTPPSRKPPQTYPPQGQSEITPRTPQFQQPRINPQALERFRQQQQLQPRQTPQTMTPY
ncbi:MAG: hypothetical protein KDK48_03410, partial [Chlamydiia bacterium]|nr:hypothetical protein [Chlamydiia bacterium]